MLYWISADHVVDAKIRLHKPLFTKPVPGCDGDFLDDLNKDSREILIDCKLKPCLVVPELNQAVQFEYRGYFFPDTQSKAGHLVFDRITGLRDS